MAAFSQIWRDELTGVYFTNKLFNGTGTIEWRDAMNMCANLDSGGGAGQWRLPTKDWRPPPLE